MNIDSSSLQSLLSSADGLVELEQTLPLDGELSQAFSDTLMEKIKQLNGLVEDDNLAENQEINTHGEADKQHGIAGLMNEKGVATGFARFFGKGLPSVNKFENNIDLENTLGALTSVINALGDVDLDIKFGALIEKIELVKNALPEQTDLGEKLENISKELQKMKKDVSNDNELEFSTGQSSLVAADNIEPDIGSRQADVEVIDQKRIDKDLPTSVDVAERLDKVEVAIKQINDIVAKENGLSKETGLEKQLEVIATEVESIRNTVAQKNPENIIEKEDVVNDLHLQEAYEEDNSLDAENQVAAIVATLNEPAVREKVTFAATLPELKTEQKMERASVMTMAEDKSLGITAKAEPDTLLQQENAIRKPGQENPVIVAKQDENKDFLSDIKPEPNTEKVLPRFATDIAMLNRAVMTENKAEIPAMTKHFAHPEWNKEIAERVIWMQKQEIPSAELRLNPRHLGPITIKVDVSQDQATVVFTAQHVAVKDAIEAAIPKLREMFSAQQLNLAEVDVSQQDSEQKQSRHFNEMGDGTGQGKHRDSGEMTGTEHAENAMEIADEIEAGRAIASNGILSIFA